MPETQTNTFVPFHDPGIYLIVINSPSLAVSMTAVCRTIYYLYLASLTTANASFSFKSQHHIVIYAYMHMYSKNTFFDSGENCSAITCGLDNW